MRLTYDQIDGLEDKFKHYKDVQTVMVEDLISTRNQVDELCLKVNKALFRAALALGGVTVFIGSFCITLLIIYLLRG